MTIGDKNTCWAIRGESGGFFYKNREDLNGAIYTKRVSKRWASLDGAIMARNNVDGWYTERFNVVELEEKVIGIYNVASLPAHKLPDLNSLVCYHPASGRFYKNGSGFTAKTINAATRFPSFTKAVAPLKAIGTADVQVIELVAESIKVV